MANLTEKQGHLGDLTLKSTAELRDLLRRQENVAANSKFISRLPDKGAKIHQMITRVEVALKQQEDIDKTANLFQNMVISSEEARRRRGLLSEDTEEDTLLRRLANRDEENRVVSSVQTLDSVPSSRYVNSYEKVMKQAEKRKSPKGKFLPNRTIKATDIQELSGNLRTMTVKKDVVTLEPQPSISTMENQAPETSRLSSQPVTSNADTHAGVNIGGGSTPSVICSPNGVQPRTPQGAPADLGHGRLKHKYDELLEEKLYTGEAHCTQAKTISVEESFQLQRKQKQTVENIQAKQAAEKLAQRMNVKMSGFKTTDVEGSGFSNRYRDAETVSDDGDSDDDADELDYPD